MTPADELRTAAAKLRPSSPAIAAPTAAVRIPPAAAEAIATLLEAVLSSASEAAPAHEECASWCSPETCDLSAALAVARAINNPQP